MAKPRKILEKKTSSKAKKAEPWAKNVNWDVQPVGLGEGDDADSDAGSFMDDDTEDFLPGNWTTDSTQASSTAKKVDVSVIVELQTNTSNPPSHAPPSLNADKTNSKPAISKLTFRPASDFAQIALAIESQFVVQTSGSSIVHNSNVTFEEHSPQAESPNEEEIEHVTYPILQHPASQFRPQQALSENEALWEEVRSLRAELAQKERELESSKAETLQAELAVESQKQHAEILQSGLKWRHERECKQLEKELKDARAEVQTERKRATTDLRKEREENQRLLRQTETLTEGLRTESAKSKTLAKEVDRLKIVGRTDQDTIKFWFDRAKSNETKISDLETRLETSVSDTKSLRTLLSQKAATLVSFPRPYTFDLGLILLGERNARTFQYQGRIGDMSDIERRQSIQDKAMDESAQWVNGRLRYQEQNHPRAAIQDFRIGERPRR